MTEVPDGLHYTKDHEWAKVDGNRARVGITDHAQDQLTDVVYVELPAIGKVVKQGEQIGVVESVKAASEIYAPVSGKVVEVNKTLEDKPVTDGWRYSRSRMRARRKVSWILQRIASTSASRDRKHKGRALSFARGRVG